MDGARTLYCKGLWQPLSRSVASDARSTAQPHRPRRLLGPPRTRWLGGGEPTAANHEARPHHGDVCDARDRRGGLCGGVVLLQPRPDATVHPRRSDGSDDRDTEGRQVARRRREWSGVAGERARVRADVPAAAADGQIQRMSAREWRVTVGEHQTTAVYEPGTGESAERPLFVCAHGAGGNMSDRGMLATAS